MRCGLGQVIPDPLFGNPILAQHEPVDEPNALIVLAIAWYRGRAQATICSSVAKRTLDELASDRLVKRERGRGTKVIYRAPTPPVNASVEGLLENLLTMGLETEVDLLEFGYVTPDAEIAALLQCSETCQVQLACPHRVVQFNC